MSSESGWESDGLAFMLGFLSVQWTVSKRAYHDMLR